MTRPMIKLSAILWLVIGIFAAGCGKKSTVRVPTPPPISCENISDPVIKAECELENEVRLRAKAIEAKKQADELRKARTQNESQAMKKAREQVEEDYEDLRDLKERDAKALIRAAVEGCPSGSVWVAYKATGTRSFQPHVKVRVLNLHNGPIDIHDESGVVVRNLCSGGSLTLFRRRDPFLDSNNITFQFKAIGRFPDGSLGTQQSMAYYLSAWDASYQSAKYYIWQITLFRHYSFLNWLVPVMEEPFQLVQNVFWRINLH